MQCMIAHTRPAAADATEASATEGPRAVAHKEQGSLTRRIMPALRPKELVKELAPMVARATTNVAITGKGKIRKRRAAQGRCGASSQDETVIARGRWQTSRQFSWAMIRDPGARGLGGGGGHLHRRSGEEGAARRTGCAHQPHPEVIESSGVGSWPHSIFTEPRVARSKFCVNHQRERRR